MMNQNHLSNLFAYWVVENDLYDAPVDIISQSPSGRIKIKFQPGFIFGVQYIETNQLDKPIVYGHMDEEYKILICEKTDCRDKQEQIRQTLL